MKAYLVMALAVLAQRYHAYPLLRPRQISQANAASTGVAQPLVLLAFSTPTSGAFSLSGTQYKPPSGCEDACSALVADKDKCEDDSCLCSQDGVNDLITCALCDTRLAMKQAKFDLNATFYDLKEICEHEGFHFTNITLPINATLSSSSSILGSTTSGDHNDSVTSADPTAHTAVRLTSAAYASISIASGSGFVTAEGDLGALTAQASQGRGGSATLGLQAAVPLAPSSREQFTSAAVSGTQLVPRRMWMLLLVLSATMWGS